MKTDFQVLAITVTRYFTIKKRAFLINTAEINLMEGNGLVYVNSNIPEYIKGNFISNQYNLDHTGRLIWNIIYDFRKTDLNKNNFIRKYGKLIEHPMDEIIKIFLEKQYIASEKDISLTWNGIVNIMDVEETINNIFEPKEPNKQ